MKTRTHSRTLQRAIAGALCWMLALCVWAPSAHATMPVIDWANLAESMRSSMSDANALRVQEGQLEKQRQILEAQMRQLENADINTTRGVRELLSRARGVMSRAQAAQGGQVGWQEAGLVGRADALYGPRAPWEPGKMRDERARALYEALAAGARAAEVSARSGARVEELYAILNDSTNTLQATKAANELLFLLNAQRKADVEMRAANARVETLRGLEAERERQRAVTLAEQTLELGAGTTPHEPVATELAAMNASGARAFADPGMTGKDAKIDTRAINSMFARNMRALHQRLDGTRSVVMTLLILLGVIEVVWLAARAQLTGEALVAPLAQKLMMIAVIMALVGSWGAVTHAARGYVVSGTGGDVTEAIARASNPAEIAREGFEKVEHIFSREAREKIIEADSVTTGLNPKRPGILDSVTDPGGAVDTVLVGLHDTVVSMFTVLVVVVVALLVVFVQIYSAAMVYVIQVEFLVVTGVGLLFVPFAVNKHTSFLANAAFNSVIASAVKLAVLIMLVGMLAPLIKELQIKATPSIGEIMTLLTGVVIHAFVITRAPSVASQAFRGAGGGVDVAGMMGAAAASVSKQGGAQFGKRARQLEGGINSRVNRARKRFGDLRDWARDRYGGGKDNKKSARDVDEKADRIMAIAVGADGAVLSGRGKQRFESSDERARHLDHGDAMTRAVRNSGGALHDRVGGDQGIANSLAQQIPSGQGKSGRRGAEREEAPGSPGTSGVSSGSRGAGGARGVGGVAGVGGGGSGRRGRRREPTRTMTLPEARGPSHNEPT